MSRGVLIDAAGGEHGGHLLRTALSLSLLSGLPFRMTRLLTKRSPPGLAEQHLAVIRLAGKAGGAKAAGVKMGSGDLYFEPTETRSGEFSCSVPATSPASLLLTTVAPALCRADGASRVTIVGGTHVPMTPTTELLTTDWEPVMEKMGFPVKVRVNRTGFPSGEPGEILALIPGGGRGKPLNRRVRSNLRVVQGKVFYSRMPERIADRMGREARLQLRRTGVAVRVEVEERKDALGGGIGIHLEAVLEDESRVGFTQMGSRAKSPDWTARGAVNDLFDWLDSGCGVTAHLANLILVPLSLASGPSVLTTPKVTRAILSNADLIQRFQIARVRVTGEVGQPGEIRIEPR